MKIAHLILAHSSPQHLERMIDQLGCQDAYFFIHVDRKVILDSFMFLGLKDHVFLITNRVNVSWGAYSIVQATINGLKQIVNSGLEVDYVNLLSGSDYALKSPCIIHDFFSQHRGQNFMEYQFVNEEWQEAIPRLKQYHLTNYSFPGKYFFQKWINKLAPDRILPDGLVAVGRSQWMSITIEAVLYIIQYLDKHPHTVQFFKLTWAPDEIIFQTILYNSDFRESLINDNLRYIDWSAGKPSPKMLGEEDLENLLNSGKLFARKFDSLKDPAILDLLDANLKTSDNC